MEGTSWNLNYVSHKHIKIMKLYIAWSSQITIHTFTALLVIISSLM